MTEQEMTQEIARLNERLTNAVKVFKQQKNEIELLKQERDNLKAQIASSEEQLSSASDINDKYFAQIEEIDSLKANLASVSECNKNALEKIKELEGVNKVLRDTAKRAYDALKDIVQGAA